MRAAGYRPSVKTADTSRMWTKAIWDRVPWDQIQAGQREGWVFFDDFTNQPAWTAALGDVHKYAVHADTGGTFTQAADDEHGALAILTGTTDNFESWIQTGGNTGGLAKFIDPSVAKPHMIAFEARWKSSVITGSAFIGFGEEGLAAADTLADGDGLADKDMLGFHLVAAELDFSWRVEGGAATTIVDACDTLVADTYVKSGFIYDYRNPAAKFFEIYNDGVLSSTYGTKTQVEDATFPDGQEMALLAGTKNGAGAAKTMTIDWWRAALVVM